MEMILFPFKTAQFDMNTKILLDASFLLGLAYDYDTKHSDCILILRQLIISKCTLYTTSMISSEVLNQMIFKLFVADIRYKIDRTTPFNSIENIKSIIYSFNKHDKKIIKDKDEDKFIYIPLKRYFDNLSKNSIKRQLLRVYYETGVKMFHQLESTIKLKTININEHCVYRVNELVKKDMLSVNDAYHLASAECNNVTYLLTLDGDFIYAESSFMKILKI